MPTLSALAQTRTTVAPPVFAGAFRWVAAGVLVLGALLQVIEFLLQDASDGATRVASWAEQPARIEIAMAAGILAVPFLLGGIAVLVALTLQSSPRLAWT